MSLSTIKKQMDLITVPETKEQKLRAKMTAVMKAEEAAKAKAEAAAEAGDPAAYSVAISEARAAVDLYNSYVEDLSSIKPQTAISEAEYNNYVKQIKSELDTLTATAKNNAAVLISQLKDIEKDINAQVKEGNKMLQELQSKYFSADIAGQRYTTDFAGHITNELRK